MKEITTKGLHLPPGQLGLGAAERKEISEAIGNQWDTLDSVEEELAKKGFSPLDKPSYNYPGPVTPQQLTTDNNQDYSTIYAQHLGWFNYAATLLARVKARLLGFKTELDDIEVRIRKKLRADNRKTPREERYSEQDISDEIHSDKRYREIMLEKQRFDQTRLEVESYLESIERNLRVISRQVEIKKLEQEGSKTGTAMPGRGQFASPRFPAG